MTKQMLLSALILGATANIALGVDTPNETCSAQEAVREDIKNSENKTAKKIEKKGNLTHYTSDKDRDRKSVV